MNVQKQAGQEMPFFLYKPQRVTNQRKRYWWTLVSLSLQGACFPPLRQKKKKKFSFALTLKELQQNESMAFSPTQRDYHLATVAIVKHRRIRDGFRRSDRGRLG